MATYTDDFNRANESPIASPWAVVTGTPEIGLNQALGAAFNAYNVARIPTATTSIAQDDHYAQVVVAVASDSAGERYVEVCVRCSASANTYYGFRSDNTSSVIFKMQAGTPTNLATGGAAFTATDVIRLEVSGTSLTAKINGGTALTTTDSDISSGDPGWGIHSNNVQRLDNFEAGDLATATHYTVTTLTISPTAD